MSVPGYNVSQLGLLDPQQQQIFQSLAGSLGGGLGPLLGMLQEQAMGRGQAFEPGEQAATKFFREQVTPRIAEQQTAMGGARTSGMLNRLQEAGTGLAEQLAMNRQQLQQQAMQNLLGLSQNILGTKTQQQFFTPTRGTQLLHLLGQLLGQGPRIVEAGAKIAGGFR